MFGRIRSMNEWTAVRNTLTTPLAIVTLALGVLAPSVSAADEVTDWNQILVSALTATNTSPQNAGRIAAMTHAAVFDAVNGIDRRYTPYFVTDEAPRGASRRAAAVQAAYVVLKTLLPAQAPGLERQRDASIAAIRLGDRAVDRGIDVGPIRRGRAPDGTEHGRVPEWWRAGLRRRYRWEVATRGGPAGRHPLARGVDAVCDADARSFPARRPPSAHQRCLCQRL